MFPQLSVACFRQPTSDRGERSDPSRQFDWLALHTPSACRPFAPAIALELGSSSATALEPELALGRAFAWEQVPASALASARALALVPALALA